MDIAVLELQEHAKVFDERCPVCKHPQRVLLEKWYIQRRPIEQLVQVFALSKSLITLHARAVKIYKKRSNNTAILVDLVLEHGAQMLEEGKLELSIKDIAWAVGHRDKLLGRIVDKKEINNHPVLHVHTTIPGVGGIGDKDVRALKAAEVRERLPQGSDITFLAEIQPDPHACIAPSNQLIVSENQTSAQTEKENV